MWNMWSKYKYCECCLEYNNVKDDLTVYKCLCSKRNYQKKFDEDLRWFFDISGPILESAWVWFSRKTTKMGKKMLNKGIKSKIFENLGKNVQHLKIIWKRAGDCVQLSHAINC